MGKIIDLLEAYKEHIDKNPSEIPMFRQSAIVEAGFTEVIKELRAIKNLLKKEPPIPYITPKADK